MIQYQVITLMTTNGQAPFITIFMYLNEVPEGRTRDDLAMVIEEVLKQRIQGIKNEKGVYITPAFPKLIYVLEEDNIHEDSKYWYLTRLAAECTAKRMVPDYISEKIMFENKVDKMVRTLLSMHGMPFFPDTICGSGDKSAEILRSFQPGCCNRQSGGCGMLFPG